MKRLYNHVLFNGRKMVCVSADNPAVTTLLELTEANCVPPNQNITVIIKAKDSISTQRYTRDLAMAAVFCFAGGVGLTLAVVYIIYFKLRMNKSLKTWREGPGAEEQDKGRPAKTQTVTQVDLDEEYQVINMAQMGLETKLMLPNSNKKGSFVEPWDQERVLTNPRIGPAHRHFLCPQCKVTVNGSAVVQKRGPDGLFGTPLNMIIQGAAHPKKSLAMTEESDVTDQSSWIRSAEVKSSSTLSHQEGSLSNQQGYHVKTHGSKQPSGSSSNHSSAQRNIRTNLKDDMVENQPSNKDFQTEYALPNRQTQMVNCVNCHRAYEYGKPVCKLRDVSYKVQAKRYQNPLTGITNENQSNMNVIRSAREQRSVKFYIESSEVNAVAEQKIKRERKDNNDRIKSSTKMEHGAKQMLRLDSTGRYARSKDHSKRPKQGLQSNGLLKVKLNLHPFKKSKIHPRKKSLEEEQSDNREQVISQSLTRLNITGEHGNISQNQSKDGLETTKKEHSMNKHKQRSHRNHQSSKKKLTSKCKATNGDVQDIMEEEHCVPPKQKESYKQKKTTSKSKHQAGLSGAHPEESGPAEYQKTDLSQKGIGGTEDSSGGLIPSHLCLSQSDSNKPVGSSVQQVGQYEGHLTTEIQHLSYHGDEVAVQKTRSDPQQSTTPALTGMECISTISNLPVQGGTSIVSQSTFAPYNAYDGHLLDGQNIAQLVQGSGYLNEQNISQIARGPGSVDGQNISQLAQSLESLDGDNLSNNSKNPAPVLQEILASAEGSPRKIRLVMPERTPNRPPSALEKKIR